MSTTTLGRYQIIREIARSNDIVYEARDPVMGRRIALKELAMPPSLVGQARRERIERFFREAKAAGSLAPHPHIVTIYEVGQQGDRYFIAMEYLEGRPLRDVLQMEGAMPVERVRRLGAQVCDALDYAHQRGVIHRDIKPDNIHVLPGDLVKLTDFGIARITADPSITADGQVFGTPSYMSPEQVEGKPLDARTDVFSLGVMLYEMLTGRKPFTGDSVVTITYNIMSQEPPPMVGVPPDVQDVVFRALVKSPDGRFRSAVQMRDALANARAVTGSMPAGGYVPGRTILPGSQAGVGSYQSSVNSGAGAHSPLATHHSPGAGPEPTAIEPPPIYVPRYASWGSRWLKRQGQFLSTLAIAVVLSILAVLFIWVGNRAYQDYQTKAVESQAAVYVQRGVSLYNGKRYSEAAAEFQRAMQIAPNTQQGRIARGNTVAAYIEMGNQHLVGNRPAQAAQAYSRALQYDSRSAQAHYGLGMAYHQSNQVSAAIGQWQWVVENAPADASVPDARRNLSVVFLEQGMVAYNANRYEDAQGALEQCLHYAAPGSQEARQARELMDRMLSGSFSFR